MIEAVEVLRGEGSDEIIRRTEGRVRPRGDLENHVLIIVGEEEVVVRRIPGHPRRLTGEVRRVEGVDEIARGREYEDVDTGVDRHLVDF